MCDERKLILQKYWLEHAFVCFLSGHIDYVVPKISFGCISVSTIYDVHDE